MTEHERDARVSGAYRGLGRDEPPPQLDVAILAASARRRSRWAVPVSVAAVVVLAVGVTLRVQMEERKEAEGVALSPQVLEAPAPAADRAFAESRNAAPARPPAAAPPQVAMERRAKLAQEAIADRAEPAGRAGAGVAVGKITAAPETPAQWLERIAKLREAGKAREADESLAEFRKRHPGYKMSEAMRARVVPR